MLSNFAGDGREHEWSAVHGAGRWPADGPVWTAGEHYPCSIDEREHHEQGKLCGKLTERR
jgi:hypothetical protein